MFFATRTRRAIVGSLVAVALAVGLCAGMSGRLPATAATMAHQVVALPGYTVSVFATGTAAYSHPDSLVTAAGHVFVGYQNVTAKDGSDHKSSTVVEYTLSGQFVRAYSALGHNDGLRVDPVTQLVWALTDEDGNPRLTTIDPTTGTTTLYHFSPTPHGGGYDDMAFMHGMAFMDASNPTLNKAGANVFPALDTVGLQGSTVVLTPTLMGNGSATDLTTNQKVTLNEIDPDSMTIDPQGDLVMDNQAGSELVFIHNPGSAHQTVHRLPIGDQIDDAVWATAAHGRLLVADTAANTVYAVRASFVPGTVYAAAPNDSGVAGFVGTLDLKTGILVPVIIGVPSPHGLSFVPDAQG